MLPDPMTLSTLVDGADGRARCGWARGDVLERYHDDEWGVPLHGDVRIFEKLSLEGFQSGLSWAIVLRKRDAFRRDFAGFEPATVAAFGEDEVQRLLADPSIIRNRMKIEAVVANARAVAALIERDGDGALDRLLWSATPARHAVPVTFADVPASTPESKALAKALKVEGLRFVGPTTMYALMQSAGVVDDHVAGCWRAAPQRSARGRSEHEHDVEAAARLEAQAEVG